MRSRSLLPKLLLGLILTLITIQPVFSQDPGTAAQSGTSSQRTNPQQQPDVNQPPPAGEAQSAPPQVGFGNTTPSPAQRQVGWWWMILGFLIGLVVGALAWRRPPLEERRRDRVA